MVQPPILDSSVPSCRLEGCSCISSHTVQSQMPEILGSILWWMAFLQILFLWILTTKASVCSSDSISTSSCTCSTIRSSRRWGWKLINESNCYYLILFLTFITAAYLIIRMNTKLKYLFFHFIIHSKYRINRKDSMQWTYFLCHFLQFFSWVNLKSKDISSSLQNSNRIIQIQWMHWVLQQ